MGLASSSSQTQKSVFFSPQKGCSEVLFLDKKNFPSETVDFCLQHAIHILKAMHLWLKMKFLGAILVHPVRSQNFAGKMHLRFYNTWFFWVPLHCGTPTPSQAVNSFQRPWRIKRHEGKQLVWLVYFWVTFGIRISIPGVAIWHLVLETSSQYQN